MNQGRECIVAEPLAVEIHWQGEAIERLDLLWSTGRTETVRTPEGRALGDAVRRLVAGEAPDWPELPLRLTGLPTFRRRVLETLRTRVPRGTVLTYGQLAALAGNPRGARAVGQAMAGNPFPLLIPCHRVLSAGGKLGGFSGAGLEMKKYLLELEGITGPTPAAPETNVF